MLGFAAKIASAQASPKFITLHNFNGTDGLNPYSWLIQATNGDLYGITEYGGTNATPEYPNGSGTIFKVTPSGTLTTIHSFCAQSGCTDGAAPSTGLVQAVGGEIFGATAGGSVGGTLFKVSTSGILTTVLYGLCSPNQCAYGVPTGLVQAINGDLYGTTIFDGEYYGGTLFKVTPSGTITTLHDFCAQANCSDGYDTYAQLVQATNGYLYGSTPDGGANIAACPSGAGCGTIFKITTSGTLTTLYSSCAQPNCLDGQAPQAGLIQATDGYLYGTTVAGGAHSKGTVFRISPSGALTTLYSFCAQSGCGDGQFPMAGLLQATDGALYGATNGGGASGTGTIFEITPSGTLTTLYSFCSQPRCSDGAFPLGLMQSTNGIFYGTTGEGGVNGDGTVFSLSTGQRPFVETRPTSGTVGKTVTILGYKLTGASSVTFNGEPAAFTVESDTEIKTTVPAGAASGKVQVVTPTDTLSSNVRFLAR